MNLSQSSHQTCTSEQPLTAGTPPSDRPIVLDTNVVLDWLLFHDPSSAHLSGAIARRELRWVASLAMRDELANVLRRGLAQARHTDAATALAAWDAHVTLVTEPPALPAAMGLQCSDRDDQKFLELAHAEGARWLLSRDRAVLKLAGRARRFGILISVPERWSAP